MSSKIPLEEYGHDAESGSQAVPRASRHLLISTPEYLRAPVAECCGTMILVLFGIASNAYVPESREMTSRRVDTLRQAVLARPDGSNFLALRLGWGAGLLVGVLLAGDISGAHLNPAITLALAVYRDFPWSRVIPYMTAQLLGAILAGVICQANYYELANTFEGGYGVRTFGLPTSSASAFITVPQPWMSNIGESADVASGHIPTATGAFFDEVLGTALLCISVLTINEGARAKLPIHLRAVALMWAFIGVSGALGIQTSFGLNPARDLGPRIAAAMFRYPATIWTDRQGYFFYGAVLGPVAGAVLGAGLWEILLGQGLKVGLRRKH